MLWFLEEDETRDKAVRKKLQKLPSFRSNRSQTSPEHRPKIFLLWKCKFSKFQESGYGLKTQRVRCRCSGLSNHAARSQGCPSARALERSFYKLVAGKTVLEDKAKQFRLAGRGKKMGWGVITLTKIYLARARKCQRQAHAVALTEENGRIVHVGRVSDTGTAKGERELINTEYRNC